jgi:2-aminoadipate transaminase
MDYSRLYSQMARIGVGKPNSAATPAQPDLISLVYGLPDPSTVSTSDLLAATELVLTEHRASALQYGPSQGLSELREFLAERLNEREGLTLAPGQILLTGGASQGIGLIARTLLEPGDTILVEAPTFLGAVRAFRLSQPRVIELPVDGAGLVTEALDTALARLAGEGVRPKFLYTMPTFQNPTGATMPLERRQHLLGLARQHNLLVVEDDAYGDLRYDGLELPSLLALDRDGLVVRLGTFSKVLAAGMRLGWAAGPAPLVRALTALKDDSGTSPYISHLALAWAGGGRLDPHLERLRRFYRERRDAALAALDRYCTGYVRWSRPLGGFYVWLELDDAVDAALLRRAADRLGVDYLPGQACFLSDRGERYLRLSFSFVDPDRIEQAIQRLGQALAEAARAPERR